MVVDIEELQRRLEEAWRKAGLEDRTPSFEEAAAVFEQIAEVRVRASKEAWSFIVGVEGDDDPEVHVTLERAMYPEDEQHEQHVAQVLFVLGRDDELEEAGDAHVQVAGSAKAFLRRAREPRTGGSSRAACPGEPPRTRIEGIGTASRAYGTLRVAGP